MTASEQGPPTAADIERLGPWGAAALARPEPAPAEPPPAPPPPSATSQIGWALASTALLAAWLIWQWGVEVALAGVVGVFVHEMGHLAAINSLGCGPGRIHIIPFFGGAASMRRAPDSEFKGVLIALAGPVVGVLACAPFYLLYTVTHQPVWLKAVLFIGVVNLLNLAPAPPLDGSKALGPALAWIHPQVERAVMVILGGLGVGWAVTHHQPFIAVFIGLGALQALLGRTTRLPARRLTTVQWLGSIGLWLGAVALCAGATWSALSHES